MSLAGAALFQGGHDERIEFETGPNTHRHVHSESTISEDFPEPLCDYESIGLAGTSVNVGA